MKLVIFDLDQTLVDLAHLHNEVTHRLLKKHFGIEAWLTEIEHAGRSQRDGLSALAAMKGVTRPVFEGKVEQVLAEFGAEFRSELAANMPADVSGILLPGAAALLEALSHTDNVLTLYTGDAPGVVDAVLGATGLGRFFAYRFSGTQFAKREDMVKQAIASAGAGAGREFRGEDVVIIGDAIRDVQCGLAFQALTIGVATGDYSAAQLKQAGADIVVPTLRDTRSILVAISGLQSAVRGRETGDSGR